MPRLNGISRINAYVAMIFVVAATASLVAWSISPEYPGTWAVVVFSLIAFLLEISATNLRGGNAVGSLAFILHLSAFLLFGPFWAALIAGISTFASELAAATPANRVLFNSSQKALSILAAASVFSALGGTSPPSLIVPGVSISFEVATRELIAFLAGGSVYFATNSMMVSGAVAITTGRTFASVWATNTLWVLGYDIAASTFSLFVAWLYLLFDNPSGLSRFGFLAVFAPIVVIKHAYSKLNTLQRLFGELDGAHVKLEQNVREQLAMMVKSIEARDPYTSGHSMRVAAVSKAIAIDFGLAEELIVEVENAALLHDVGKIHAEFAPLLQKEGKLTPEEWDIMKTHSVKSAELVGLFSRFKGHVQDSVRHHHERWDGLGYPDGVSGESIPLGARIIMIADTIDAMTTDRPYRKALGFDAVVAELLKHRGTQFDPRLVASAVSSVTIRRMIAEPNLGVSSVDVGLQIVQSPPLRSYDSFFLGRRRS